ncbi:MAG: heliorhodopsin HeR [Anaerolineaceae bacterium]
MAKKSSTTGRPAPRNLRRWNLAMAALHLAQGTLLLLIASSFSLPVTAAFVEMNEQTQALEPRLRTLFDVRIAPIIASFLFMSAIAHLVVSLPAVYPWYQRNLGRGINYARWIEYAFSSSVMIVVIAMLVGIYDVVGLISIFALNATMILFGWMMERHNQSTESTDWTAYIFGCVAGIVPWLGVAIYLAGAGGTGDGVPTFVYYIFGTMFVVFNIFAINMFLQYRRIGPWRDYVFGEFVYIMLSLSAKSLLAWQVYAGTLQPN